VDSDNQRFDSVYTNKVRAGKRRTYFFDVRKTKGEDYYVTITESTRKFNGDGYERHKVFIYKEDFNRFLSSLEDTVNHIKKELLPDYDYDEFTKKQEEWERQKAEDEANGVTRSETPTEAPAPPAAEAEVKEDEKVSEEASSEEDMSW